MKKMKQMYALVLVLVLVLGGTPRMSCGFSARAEDTVTAILKGTPVFDGQVDDMYEESLTLSTGIGENAYASTSEWSNDHGNIYFLWDDSYLYICADIYDDSVCSRGDMYVAGNNPNQNDNCEFRLCLNSGIEGAESSTIKLGIDAYGLRAYGTSAAEMEKTDYSKIQYKTTYRENGANSGYVIEAAIPHTDGGIFDLLTAGRLGFKLQLNDLDYDGSYRFFATDYAGEGAKGLVYYELSNQLVTGGDINEAPEMIKDKIEVTDYMQLSFGAAGGYIVYSNLSTEASGLNNLANGGNSMLNTEDGAIDITYGGVDTYTVNKLKTQYKLSARFAANNIYDTTYKYMRVLYSATNPSGAENVQMKLYGAGVVDPHIVTFDGYINNTNGEFVLSPAVQLTDTLATRYLTGRNHLIFTATEEGGLYQVKSFYFFKTQEDADNFEVPTGNEKVDFQKMSFAADGNSFLKSGGNYSDAYGDAVSNLNEGTVDILYSNTIHSNQHNSRYWASVGFNAAGVYDTDYRYIRVLYSAANPEGTGNVQMKFINPAASGEVLTLSNTVSNTNGEFVLSDVGMLSDAMSTRYTTKGGHNQLMFTTETEGGVYRIKAFYFFKSAEDAAQFTVDSELTQIQINGNDISLYRIVVPVDGLENELSNAQSIAAKIYSLTNVQIPIVYDSEATTEYEILIGRTNREESQNFYTLGGQFHPSYEQFSVSPYRIERIGNKLCLIAAAKGGVDANAELFLWLLDRHMESGEGCFNITAEVVGRGLNAYTPVIWPERTNVENPTVFTDGFDTDEGYWTTDSDKVSWVFAVDGENAVFSSGNADSSLSYLHVWEKNVSYEAKFEAVYASSGQAGLVLRHTADHAYIKAGYDYTAGEWFIDVRNGADFLEYRVASYPMQITADQWYEIKAVVNEENAELYVNGEKIAETDDLTQLTQGRVGMFADDVSALIDDVEITLLSGQGTIIKNTVHTKLPDDEEYREGGTVLEMLDGSLLYISKSWNDDTFRSTDSGKTWTRADGAWDYAYGYPHVLRLDDGQTLLRINREKIEDVFWWIAQISVDDGNTWTTQGKICTYYYPGSNETMVGGNMNDKLTQMSDGRIFYVVNYECKTIPLANGSYVFGEVYYSDNNGVTWTKSTMDTFDIEGNDPEENSLAAYFGESKVLETAEGKLRLYNSWNAYGYMAYSESDDNGETWGPLQIMMDFPCSTSSMQFVKDPYADNETTYYMVWVENDTGEIVTGKTGTPRSRLSLAKSTDGINWVALGDVWHWESYYRLNNQYIAHIVDPFVRVTEDYVLVGSGLSEKAADNHHAQRQHIWSIQKDTLE